jgi:hypothetical protein
MSFNYTFPYTKARMVPVSPFLGCDADLLQRGSILYRSGDQVGQSTRFELCGIAEQDYHADLESCSIPATVPNALISNASTTGSQWYQLMDLNDFSNSWGNECAGIGKHAIALAAMLAVVDPEAHELMTVLCVNDGVGQYIAGSTTVVTHNCHVSDNLGNCDVTWPVAPVANATSATVVACDAPGPI